MSNDLEFKSMLSQDLERSIRLHKIEGIGKFTLALSCLIFFFIGAPLGAIIRKGGLGIPVIISVTSSVILPAGFPRRVSSVAGDTCGFLAGLLRSRERQFRQNLLQNIFQNSINSF